MLLLDFKNELPELYLNLNENVVGIFGASGAGKSSFLKNIAGIDDSLISVVHYDGLRVDTLSAYKSPIYYLDQGATLFPHLSVRKNLLLVLAHGCFASENSYQFEDVINWCQIESILDQMPLHLSGGQMQKVLFAQSLLSGKKLILLDEPFSALDWKVREHFCQLIQYLHQHFHKQFLFVSHSLKELAMSTNYLLHLDHFKVIKSGISQKLISSLSQEPGQTQSAILSGKIDKIIQEFNLAKVKLGSNSNSQFIYITAPHYDLADVNIEIEANKVSLCKKKPSLTSIVNCLLTRVKEININKHFATIILEIENQILMSNISLLSLYKLELTIGEDIYAQFKVL
ncbi:ATP-binding cassette domain-containing protein [Thalassotalea ganghwensis]